MGKRAPVVTKRKTLDEFEAELKQKLEKITLRRAIADNRTKLKALQTKKK